MVCFLFGGVVVVREKDNFQDKLKLYGKSPCALSIPGINIPHLWKDHKQKYFIFSFVTTNI